MSFLAILLCSFSVFSGFGTSAWAQESSQPVAAPAAVAPQSAPQKISRKRRPEVRETEGSVAPNRFEAETILKSQYHHEGEQLEVDPD